MRSERQCGQYEAFKRRGGRLFVALVFIVLAAAVLLSVFPEVLELYHTIDSYLQ